MARLYPMLLFALLVLVLPVESAGQNGKLAKLNEVQLVFQFIGSGEKKSGLSKNDLERHVLILLRNKLPNLAVNASAESSIHVYVNMDIGTAGKEKVEVDYHGVIGIIISRPVIIKKTFMSALIGAWEPVGVYETQVLFSGPFPSEEISVHVRDVLDKVITTFALRWNQGNP